MMVTVLFVVLSLCCLAWGLAPECNGDTPCGESPLEDFGSCGYIIPMDYCTPGMPFDCVEAHADQSLETRGQNSGEGFNLKVYGLLVTLLWEDILLKWIIKPNKVKDHFYNVDERDFYKNVSMVYPVSDDSYHMRAFNGGAFAIPIHLTEYADPIIRAWNDALPAGREIVVYKMSDHQPAAAEPAGTFLPIRHTLTSKPYVAVFDSGGLSVIMMNYMLRAGMTRDYDLLPDGSTTCRLVDGWGKGGLCENRLSRGEGPAHFRLMSKDDANSPDLTDVCITMATEPHFGAGETDAPAFVTAAKRFVVGGANFFAECHGVQNYENCDEKTEAFNDPDVCTEGRMASTTGFVLNQGKGAKFGPASATAAGVGSTPLLQYDGQWTLQGGSVKNFYRKDAWWTPANSGGNTWSWPCVETTRDGETYDFLAQARHNITTSPKGHNVFYLAGHEYKGGEYAGEAGARVFLNAVLIPSNRAAKCGLDVDEDRYSATAWYKRQTYHQEALLAKRGEAPYPAPRNVPRTALDVKRMWHQQEQERLASDNRPALGVLFPRAEPRWLSAATDDELVDNSDAGKRQIPGMARPGDLCGCSEVVFDACMVCDGGAKYRDMCGACRTNPWPGHYCCVDLQATPRTWSLDASPVDPEHKYVFPHWKTGAWQYSWNATDCPGYPWTMAPTPYPTITTAPTSAPSSAPTSVPTMVPTPAPTTAPTPAPTTKPTWHPTPEPTPEPTPLPTPAPTFAPGVACSVIDDCFTCQAHDDPYDVGTAKCQWCRKTGASPDSGRGADGECVAAPAGSCTLPGHFFAGSVCPTLAPTSAPTGAPTMAPTPGPTPQPPTPNPTVPFTAQPTPQPTVATQSPTAPPTPEPTPAPSPPPTPEPTPFPPVMARAYCDEGYARVELTLNQLPPVSASFDACGTRVDLAIGGDVNSKAGPLQSPLFEPVLGGGGLKRQVPKALFWWTGAPNAWIALAFDQAIRTRSFTQRLPGDDDRLQLRVVGADERPSLLGNGTGEWFVVSWHVDEEEPVYGPDVPGTQQILITPASTEPALHFALDAFSFYYPSNSTTDDLLNKLTATKPPAVPVTAAPTGTLSPTLPGETRAPTPELVAAQPPSGQTTGAAGNTTDQNFQVGGDGPEPAGEDWLWLIILLIALELLCLIISYLVYRRWSKKKKATAAAKGAATGASNAEKAAVGKLDLPAAGAAGAYSPRRKKSSRSGTPRSPRAGSSGRHSKRGSRVQKKKKKAPPSAPADVGDSRGDGGPPPIIAPGGEAAQLEENRELAAEFDDVLGNIEQV